MTNQEHRVYLRLWHQLNRESILERKRRTYWNKPGERERVLAIRKKHDKEKYQERRKSLHTQQAAQAMIEDCKMTKKRPRNKRKAVKKKKTK